MKRASAAAVATALVLGMVGTTPSAAAETACADPEHPIRGFNRLDAAVGVRAVTTFELGVYPSEDCGVTSAVAVVTSPRRTYRVTLSRQPDPAGSDLEAWTGPLRIDPRTLRNSDAGSWSVRYEVAGEHPESVVDEFGQVVRESRLTLRAGPEKPRHGVTLRGRLTRADWDRHRFTGVQRTVALLEQLGDGSLATVATSTTRRDGRYRTTLSSREAVGYQAFFPGDQTSSLVYSRVDPVRER